MERLDRKDSMGKVVFVGFQLFEFMEPFAMTLPRLCSTMNEAKNLHFVIKEGVLIMDEVDTLLHPLKSELNFTEKVLTETTLLSFEHVRQ